MIGVTFLTSGSGVAFSYYVIPCGKIPCHVDTFHVLLHFLSTFIPTEGGLLRKQGSSLEICNPTIITKPKFILLPNTGYTIRCKGTMKII